MNVVASNNDVAECAVIGIHDELKGQFPVGFIVLKSGVDSPGEVLENELAQMVRGKIGAVASFKKTIVTNRLPKTRSGKILRKVMRNMADGKGFSPPSTIEDMSVLGELENIMKEKHVGHISWQ